MMGFMVVGCISPLPSNTPLLMPRLLLMAQVFLIALTIPGNSYPATEPPNKDNPTSLLGQACKSGYQSHYLEATQSGQPAVNVGDGYGDGYGDELVVFEGSQTLPLFLVYITEFGGGGGEQVASTLTDNLSADETIGPKGWSFLNQGSGEEEGESGVGGNVNSQGEILISF